MDLYLDKIDLNAKRIIIADFDGVLSESKKEIDKEMAALIAELLKYRDFAVISGKGYELFQRHLINQLSPRGNEFSHLYLLPTCGMSFYKFDNNEWRCVYSETLTKEQKDRIMHACPIALKSAGFKEPEKLYGELIEDRGTQITFSAFGQLAPLELKVKWDPNHSKRLKIKAELEKIIPEFEITVAGTTSIDITKKGLNKAYGIRKISEDLKFSLNEILYLGDALFKGGNDYPVKELGVDCISVTGPEETKKLLSKIIEKFKGTKR
jgi:hypothetical protein